jgi:hypothetical protein
MSAMGIYRQLTVVLHARSNHDSVVCTACTCAIVFILPLVIDERDDFFKGMEPELKGSTAYCVIGGWDAAQRQRRR